MRRIADLHPGLGEDLNARDAYVIADAARTLPHTLRRVDTGDETLVELEAWSVSMTTSPAKPPGCPTASGACSPRSTPPWNESSARKSRTRLCWTCCRVAGCRIGLRKAGRRKLLSIAAVHVPRMGERLVEQIMAALDEQSVTVPARQRRKCIPAPPRPVHPTIRERRDNRRPAPTARRQQEPQTRFFLAVFAALADPVSRAYYDRKRAEGKRHNAALICLAAAAATSYSPMLPQRSPCSGGRSNRSCRSLVLLAG